MPKQEVHIFSGAPRDVMEEVNDFLEENPDIIVGNIAQSENASEMTLTILYSVPQYNGDFVFPDYDVHWSDRTGSII